MCSAEAALVGDETGEDEHGLDQHLVRTSRDKVGRGEGEERVSYGGHLHGVQPFLARIRWWSHGTDDAVDARWDACQMLVENISSTC